MPLEHALMICQDFCGQIKLSRRRRHDNKSNTRPYLLLQCQDVSNAPINRVPNPSLSLIHHRDHRLSTITHRQMLQQLRHIARTKHGAHFLPRNLHAPHGASDPTAAAMSWTLGCFAMVVVLFDLVMHTGRVGKSVVFGLRIYREKCPGKK
ncbi:hypothetical protein Droror1_Dr00022217 [Drosera rotundifolia]